MLHGTKWVLGNEHPFLLFLDVLADGKDDSCRFLRDPAKGMVVIRLDGIRRDLLIRTVRCAVDANGNIDRIRAKLNFLGRAAVRAAAGTGATGLEAGVDGAVLAPGACKEGFTGRAGESRPDGG